MLASLQCLTVAFATWSGGIPERQPVASLPALGPLPLVLACEPSAWQLSELPTPEGCALEERMGSHPHVMTSWQQDSGGKGIGEKVATTVSSNFLLVWGRESRAIA